MDGEPAPYALARIPTDGDNRGNLAAGATGHGRPLNDRDRWLAAQIGPVLRSRGMLFVGLDVIGEFVTEINVTSPRACANSIASSAPTSPARSWMRLPGGSQPTATDHGCHPQPRCR